MDSVLKVMVWLIVGTSMFVWLGCSDHKTSIPIEFPEYEPQLVVQAAVGPISGAEATIGWSLPLHGQPGEVPTHPNLSVFLLEDERRVQQFSAHPDSTGYFSISPDQLKLNQGMAYALELLFEDTKESLFSEVDYLPAEPVMKDAQASIDIDIPAWYELSLMQAPAEKGVGAISILPILLNGAGVPTVKSGLEAYFRSPEFRYVDGGNLLQRNVQIRGSREIRSNEVSTELGHNLDVRLVYLSSGLARFRKEVDALGYFGESIYQTVRPIYSNIPGAVGVFGVYNEASATVPIIDIPKE
ncbi:DUF4249 domain-containing protein [Sphingobacterium haloxyli]|uniref:DUF4249 domain-containing protein n=1 Tax=Sphingobacterium haloxyli TaxID=2100533 RepID=A0A2S9J9B0_9SPHI|nr:DUF4249 family protein [Sphingobacterium haloxyli]PRD49376.1 hypothetical protein C5745_01795 [Sphingobacterium haloxyli]